MMATSSSFIQSSLFHASIRAVNSWMFYLHIVLLLWTSCNTSVTGEHQVIGSSQDLLVKVGDEVVLPCHIEPPVRMEKKTVEWSRLDLKPQFVYLLLDGHYKHHQDQNPLYKRRTSLFPEQLPDGNISLKLSEVQLSDQGRYRCHAPHLLSSAFIQLRVGAVSQPVISVIGSEHDGFRLSCDSGCWYPQPEVSWLDSDGNNLPAEPPVANTSSQHCYNVHADVTVRGTGHVTCRVHLPRLNHTVDARYDYDMPEDPTLPASLLALIVFPLGAVILVLSLVCGKRCYHSTGSIEMTNMTGEEEEQTVIIPMIPMTSPEPRKRKWIPVSERWRPQLEKLANIDDCKVTRVGSLLFVADQEFRIAVGSGSEVFLGLTDDGTEVVVKRMTKYFFHVLKNEKDFLRLPKLKDNSIVQYVDLAEDMHFGYLGLQLCEYTLEEYITENNIPHLMRKQLARQFFQGLRILHHQHPEILHRDIKPQNVLIDIQKKARLSDFGISRKLPKGKSTIITKVAGTKHWKAKETLDNVEFPYKRSTDIQVAGMLLYYILSGGHHPFGAGARCEGNILAGHYNLDHLQDVVAKDLIERMLNEDPKKRPRVEQCLAHPFFRSKENLCCPQLR